MNHAHNRSFEKPVRAAMWGEDMLDHQPKFAEVAVALVPASLILATAAALLVVLF